MQATKEDCDVISKLPPHAWYTWLIGHATDSIDYRAMLAREIMVEEVWKSTGQRERPADLVDYELHSPGDGLPRTIREHVELMCGEPLA